MPFVGLCKVPSLLNSVMKFNVSVTVSILVEISVERGL